MTSTTNALIDSNGNIIYQKEKIYKRIKREGTEEKKKERIKEHEGEINFYISKNISLFVYNGPSLRLNAIKTNYSLSNSLSAQLSKQ